MTQLFRLVSCGRDGGPDEAPGLLSDAVQAICDANAAYYGKAGFVPPWIGYLSVFDGVIAGGGGFVGPPKQNRVEIAYFTLEEYQGKGMALRTASALVALAREASPGIEIFAKTLPALNASTAILRRLGFQQIGSVTDAEIGEAWAWLLTAAPP